MDDKQEPINLEAEFAKQSHSKYWESNPQGFNFQKLSNDTHLSIEHIQRRWLAYTSVNRKKIEDIIPMRTTPVRAPVVAERLTTTNFKIDPNIGHSYRSEIETKFAKQLQDSARKMTNTLSLALRAAELPVTEKNMTILNKLVDAEYQDILLNMIIKHQSDFEVVELKHGAILKRYVDTMRNIVCEAIITDTNPRELGNEIMFEEYAGCVNPMCGHVGQVVWQNEAGSNETYYCQECHVSYKWETKRIKVEDVFGRKIK